jgi:HD superfamily phosphodiesterase
MARIDHLSEKVRPLYKSGDPAHDWDHGQRVIANCRFLHAREYLKNDFSSEEIEKTCTAIEEHSASAEVWPTLTLAIFIDARRVHRRPVL